MKFVKNILVACAYMCTTLLLFTKCAQKGIEYKENYEKYTWLMFLTRPTPNPQGKCEEMSQSAGSCLWQATDKPFLPPFITEEIYSANVLKLLANSDANISTYKEFCEIYLQSSTFKDWSESSKECFIKCNKDYWDTVIRIEDCNKKTTEEHFKGISSGIRACTLDCFRVTSNTKM